MKKRSNRQYFTRKNLIAFALTALFSVVMVMVSFCLDRSEGAMLSRKNPVALFANALKMPQITSGVYGIVCVALVAIYIVIFAVAAVFEGRFEIINGRSPYSKKMWGIYAATFAVCAALSLGIGLLIQPQITGQNVLNHLIFLGESLAMALMVYIAFAILIGSVAMLVINFRKVNKPFEFFNDDSLEDIMEETEEDAPPVSESFDEAAAAVAGTVSGESVAAAGAVGAAAGGAVSAAAELDDREKVFPALSSVDARYEGFEADRLASDDVTLFSLCEGFRNYLAKTEKLYYDRGSIRMFISGLNASRFILLEGLSGTGKSSLPRYFAKYVGGKATFVPVQATWRDRTSLLGYFNDFSKTYSETEFLAALYEANYDTDRINLFVLDELNISRVEYYFADFLSVLEYPSSEWKLRLMQLPVGFLPPVKLEDGVVQIPTNSYFVGTANKDDSTFTIADKVYDRAIAIDFENRNDAFEVEEDAGPIVLGASALRALFDEALAQEENSFTAADIRKLSVITDYIYDTFDIAFGNRVLNQIEALVPTYIACGGTKEEVLDFILARKVLVKLEGRFEDYIKDGLKHVAELLAANYGAGAFVHCEHEINSLLKKL